MLLDLRSLFEPVDATVALVGVQATSAVGTLAASGTAVVALTGVSTTSAIGTLAAKGDGNTSLTGVSATSAIATLAATGDGNTALTGVEAASAVGSITASADNPDATVALVGVEAVGSVGTLLATGDPLTQPVVGGGGGGFPGVNAAGRRRGLSEASRIRRDAVVALVGVEARASVGRLRAIVTNEQEDEPDWESTVDAENEELLLLLA